MQNSCSKIIQTLIIVSFLVFFVAHSSAFLKTGDIAADFDLKDINGNSVSLSSILHKATGRGETAKGSPTDVVSEGRPVILSFFATWCPTCLSEIKDLSKIVKEYNVDVYLISVDESKSKLDRFLQKHKITPPALATQSSSTLPVLGEREDGSITFPVLCDPKGGNLGKKYDLLKGAFLLVPKMVVISPSGTIEYVSESYSKEKMDSLKSVLSQIKKKSWNKSVEIAVFFTNSINGYLQSCNCYKQPYGGFIKFVSWLKQQKMLYPNHILLDTGDFLPHSVSENSAKSMFKSLEITKYDAVALGDQDIYYSGINEAVQNKKIPFISSNLMWCVSSSSGDPSAKNPATVENVVEESTPISSVKEEKACKMITEIEKVLTVNGIKIRIISFVHPDTFFLYPDEFTNKIKLTQINEILRKGKNADFLILLSHSGIDYDKKIAEEFDKIDLIIGGHSQTLLNKLVKIKHTLIVQAGGNLQYAGKIVLKFDKDKKLINYNYEVVPLVREIPDAPEIKALIEEQEKSVSGKK